ncbi:lyase family protein [Salinibacterium sp. ZJ70]|uniref:lyase family protein n=1 Tax=Salinibacterium sp. ZJ70 TaxID=2708084 RepID=UPI001423089F|nr:lyase family protein [Salinibacterium sp. ZJ70]
MSSDDEAAGRGASTSDVGLLSPVSVGASDAVSDAVVLARLIDAEAALMRAYATIGAAPSTVADVADRLAASPPAIDLSALAHASLAGGNPVIPLLPLLAERLRALDPAAAAWLHRGATSQDIVDTALMLVSRDSAQRAARELRTAADAAVSLAERHRDDPAVARTLTQHAVPTTLGLKAARWASALDAAASALDALAASVPAQLGGAGGTLASFAEILGAERAAELPAVFAAEVGLAAPLAPWHTDRAPILDAASVFGRAVAATGAVASDIAQLARTEVGEAVVGAGGGSSAMPHKRNPVDAVLLRSAAMRAPGLVSTLFLAAGVAVDERSDGAWHAEWPALQELAALAVGSAERAAALLGGLTLQPDRARDTLDASAADVVSERVAIARAHSGAAEPDLDALCGPADYLGLAPQLTDLIVRRIRAEREPT